MRRWSVMLVLPILVLFLQTEGQAQYLKRNQWYVNGFGGVDLYQDALGFDKTSEATVGGRIGYNFASFWDGMSVIGVEGTFAWSKPMSELLPRVAGTSTDLTWLTYYGALVWNQQFRNLDWFAPFVYAGGGAITFQPSEDTIDSRTKGAFAWGGGVNFLVHPSVAIRVEYQGLVTKLEPEGPAFFFGQQGKLLGTSDVFNTSKVTGGVTIYFPFRQE